MMPTVRGPGGHILWDADRMIDVFGQEQSGLGSRHRGGPVIASKVAVGYASCDEPVLGHRCAPVCPGSHAIPYVHLGSPANPPDPQPSPASWQLTYLITAN